MKAKKLMKWVFPLLMLPSAYGMAQTTIIDYGTLTSTNCNIFGTTLAVSGKNHTTVLGQPQNDAGALVLQAQPMNSTDNLYYDKHTAFKIEGNFLANHFYNVTVNARCLNSNSAMYIEAQLLNSTSTNSACTGPAQTNLPNIFYGNYVGSTQYTNVTIQVAAPNYNAGSIVFQVGPDFTYTTMQSMYVKKITIEDITPPAPTFTITSSIASRTCGTALLNPITFTVNSQNASNITGYDYIVTPFQWTIGTPATMVTNTIHQTSNTISLMPYECGSGSTLTVIPYINNVAQSPVTKTITVSTPGIKISGPSNLPSISALYDLKSSELVFPAPPPNLVCGATPYWSIDNTDLGQLFVNSAYNVGLTKNPNSFATSGTVILKADVIQCGITTTATKSVYISSPIGLMNSSSTGLSEIFGENGFADITPNPSNGIFNLRFAQSLDKAKLSIISIDGKEIFNTEVNGSEKRIDLSASPAGIYLLKIKTGSTIETKKLVKTK